MPSDTNDESTPPLGSCPHHYVLAHIALRKICLQDPLMFFGSIASEHRDEFLKQVWRQVSEQCDPQGEATFDISDVGFATCTIGVYPAIVVAMPEPEGLGEAYFAAIVLKMDLSKEDRPEKPEIFYFTLEKGARLDQSDRTVMCGWTADDSHLNYGDGPAPDGDKFVQEIEKLLESIRS